MEHFTRVAVLAGAGDHADALAAAICGLARRPALRERLARGGPFAVRERLVAQLSDAYRLALGPRATAGFHARAA